MSNFIYSGNYCCSIGERDNERLSVDKEPILVRQDTGEKVDWGYVCTPFIPEGTLLIVKSEWVLRKNYDPLARFDTEAEAKAELRRIVEELQQNNIVVEVNGI